MIEKYYSELQIQSTSPAQYEKRFLTSVLLALIIPSTAICAPSIESINVNGAVSQSTSAAISGSSFGSSSPQRNLLWDTVDNQSVYKGLSSGSPVPTDTGIWTQNGNPWSNPLTIERSGDTRASSSQAVFKGQKKSYIGWPRTFDGLTNKSLYVTWWFKPQGNMRGDSSSNKVIRIWDDYGGESTRISWTHHHMTYDAYDLGISGTVDWQDIGTQDNSWNRLEIWADGPSGKIIAQTNGEVIHNITDFKKSTINDGLTIGLIGFDPSIADNYSNFTFLIDDIYASPTRARVELSSASAWGKSNGKREIQPVTDWDDQKITFNLNLGSFSSSDTLYVYVVDAQGGVNSNGFKLSGNGSEIAPPNAPRNPTVE